MYTVHTMLLTQTMLSIKLDLFFFDPLNLTIFWFWTFIKFFSILPKWDSIQFASFLRFALSVDRNWIFSFVMQKNRQYKYSIKKLCSFPILLSLLITFNIWLLIFLTYWLSIYNLKTDFVKFPIQFDAIHGTSGNWLKLCEITIHRLILYRFKFKL